MTTKMLNAEESRRWQKKLANKTMGASPLQFSTANDLNAPFQISVTNGQAPGGRTLVIQLVKLPGLSVPRATEIVQHALVDVFGAEAGRMAELDYLDAQELKKRASVDGRFVLDADSFSIKFPPGRISATRKCDWVRSNMAAALMRWYQASQSW